MSYFSWRNPTSYCPQYLESPSKNPRLINCFPKIYVVMCTSNPRWYTIRVFNIESSGILWWVRLWDNRISRYIHSDNTGFSNLVLCQVVGHLSVGLNDIFMGLLRIIEKLSFPNAWTFGWNVEFMGMCDFSDSRTFVRKKKWKFGTVVYYLFLIYIVIRIYKKIEENIAVLI